jgi:hypothetical protein
MKSRIFISVLVLWTGVFLAAIPVGAQGLDVVSPHGELNVDLDCSRCHTDKGWVPVRDPMDFIHSRDAGVALKGRHESIECASCHSGLKFDEPRMSTLECESCHTDVHEATLSSNCENCHKTTLFTDIDVLEVHNSTAFPLSGAHEITECESCHGNDLGGAYSTISSSCDSCHQEDYDATVTIPHGAAGYSTACENCHTAVAWTFGVNFDHVASSNGFELQGAHRRVECSTCHTTPSFELTVPLVGNENCVGCHDSDYQREHESTGFSTQCLDCHNTDDWESIDFKEHDSIYFPIFSGSHRGEWDGCQSCHLTPRVYNTFSCFDCHEHNQSSTDGEHGEVGGYVYESTACLNCHPRGSGDD